MGRWCIEKDNSVTRVTNRFAMCQKCVKRGKTIVLFYDKKLLTLLYTIGIFLHVVTKTIAALAQLVEQRTENPCVPGSIPGGGSQSSLKCKGFFFLTVQLCLGADEMLF